MAKSKKWHLFGWAFLFFVITLGVAIAVVPWKDVLHGRMIAILREKGVEHVDFAIDSIGLHGITLNAVSIGKDNPLLLDKATVAFSPKELIDGNLQDISLSGLTIGVSEGKAGWIVTGLDVLPKRGDDKSAPPDIPAILAALPFKSLSIEDSRVVVSSKAISGTVPFSLKISRDALALDTEPASFEAGKNEVSIGKGQVRLAPEDSGKDWSGAWSLADIAAGEAAPLPPMNATGTATLSAEGVAVVAKASDAPATTKGEGHAVFNLADASKNKFTLESATFPFKGGKISTRNVTYAFPLKLAVSIERVSVDELMQAMTGKKVTSTGTLSGTIPLTIRKDGNFTLGKGALTADGQGRITMPGEFIPGANQQMEIVRDIMEDLHYSLLSASIVPGPDGKPGVSLRLEGRNPAAYDGREVKLNINLTGDVLDFVRQNLILFQSPEKFLTRELQ